MSNFELSRRSVLKLSPAIPMVLFNIRGDSRCVPESKKAEDIANKILWKHGVEIPTVFREEYSIKKTIDQGRQKEIIPNALMSVEELSELEHILDTMPAASPFVQLIIPFRRPNMQVAGGHYYGFDWPYILKDYDRLQLPDEKFLSKRSGVIIDLPQFASFDSPIERDLYDTQIGFDLIANKVVPSNISLHTDYKLRTSTHKDRFSQIMIHEIWGHGIWETMAIAMSKSVTDYRNRQKITNLGMNTWDIYHPLMQTFAVVNGWKLKPYEEYLDQFGTAKKNGILQRYPELKPRLVWDRDPDVWGPVADRKVRLTMYGDYGSPKEAFAEYLLGYALSPNLLTPAEQRYFSRIFSGLKRNPKRFMNSVIENPSMLLDDVHFLPQMMHKSSVS